MINEDTSSIWPVSAILRRIANMAGVGDLRRIAKLFVQELERHLDILH
jgi:hypothetical protein